MNNLEKLKETAIYIHIPFCDHKCIYCDFYSITNSKGVSEYKDALLKEISFYASQYAEGRKIISIFFGGGTPSYMEPSYIAEILNSIKKVFNVTEKAEITLETNPGTVNYEKLKLFKQAGINRLSIGVQSFNEDELKFLTRIHNRQEAITTFDYAEKAGFNNISIDLIFNLPNQSIKQWKSNLNVLKGLPISHVSAYSLILERGTILNKMVLEGQVKMQADEQDAELYKLTIDELENQGFKQYEVSNFAKPGNECIHNNAYWQYKDYLGFGTSAHSFVNSKRWWNYKALSRYLKEIENCGVAVSNFEKLSDEEMLEEFVMLSLRSSGLNEKKFEKKFSNNWLIEKKSYFNELNKKGLLASNNFIHKLTKSGYAVCDDIILNLIK